MLKKLDLCYNEINYEDKLNPILGEFIFFNNIKYLIKIL